MRERGVKQEKKLSRETATDHTAGIRWQGHPSPECANRQGEDALVTFLSGSDEGYTFDGLCREAAKPIKSVTFIVTMSAITDL